jgi:hypothetical protein
MSRTVIINKYSDTYSMYSSCICHVVEFNRGFHGGRELIDILYTLDSASLLVKLKPRIFQRLPPFE